MRDREAVEVVDLDLLLANRAASALGKLVPDLLAVAVALDDEDAAAIHARKWIGVVEDVAVRAPARR